MVQSPVFLLIIGIAIVVAGIVGLRVHPFLALIAAALTVAFLTPEESVFDVRLQSDSGIRSEESAALRELYQEDGAGEAEAFASRDISPKGVQAYLSAKKDSEQWFVSRVAEAFGEGCGSIAIIIAMASIIGMCLLDSGGARRIVDSLINLLGLKGTPIALALSAFTLGIPVFFDTVFYLLVPLARSLRSRSGKDYLLYILAIVAGATMAHSLVPPTPGPLTVATFFGDDVSIGSMMIGGLAVGLVTVSVGVGFAYWANRRWEIPFSETVESLERAGDTAEETDLPPLWFALTPIVLPLLLIGGQMIFSVAGVDMWWLQLLGDKNIALILAALSGLLLLVYQKRRSFQRGDVSAAVQRALASGGVIILITAAGSSFGSILRDTGIAETIGGMRTGTHALVLIPVAYLVTALVRTAQGSATVAMITAGGMIAPIAQSIDLPYSALYLALAIGCGSKPISWANDSGFWVIGRMSGMTPVETFKTVSVMMILMSLAGLVMVLLGAMLLPLT